jgi:aspartate racemase
VKLEVSLHAHPLCEYIRLVDANDWEGIARRMLSSAHELARTGAEFFVVPCNTIHKSFDLVTAQSSLPWLHIATEVAIESKCRGFRRVGLLGTSLIMQGDIYTSRFERLDMECWFPPENECKRLDRFIFEEMVQGRFTQEAQRYVVDLAANLRTRGCDAVGLCCTELPILLAHAELPLPVLDSTMCLATAAVSIIRQSLHDVASLRGVTPRKEIWVGGP